jgi:hypothetical protein
MHLFNYLIQLCINVTKNIFIINKSDIGSYCNFCHSIQKYEITKTSDNCFVKNILYNFIISTETLSLTPYNKFNYLKLIIFNDFFDNETKELFLNNFMKVQRKYYIILRTLRNYRYRKAKLQISTDIFLNPIDVNDKNVFVLFQNNKKYLFTISDLVNIVNSSLGNTEYFFSKPLICKNPYNNMPFNKADLYNIYFFMKSTPIIIPILFHNFFMANFSLNRFKLDNEDIIRDYAIKDYINNSSEQVLRRRIIEMIKHNYYSDNIKIHNDFPTKKLIKIMKPYLNLYLHSLYSTESNKKITYDILLNKKIKEFVKFNPRFGRKMIKGIVKKDGKRKIYSNKLEDNYITYNNDYDDNFMNNHLILFDENDDEDSDSDDVNSEIYYTSDEEDIHYNFISRESILGFYNFDDNIFPENLF